MQRRPPPLILADMQRARIEPPPGATFLGTRLEDGGRIVVWIVDGAVVEQRCPLYNVGVAARRRSFHIVRD